MEPAKEGPQFLVERYRPRTIRRFSFQDIETMADNVVKSRLFKGIDNIPAAMTLMLLCDAEGLHPIQALRRYDIIDGRPALKSGAMLGDFQTRGGKVRWITLNDTKAEAEFIAKGLAEPVTVTYTIEEARRAGLTHKQNWVKYPKDMLKARCITRGVNLADPAITGGLHSPEEVMDFEDTRLPAEYVIVGDRRPEGRDTAPSPGTTEAEKLPSTPPSDRSDNAGDAGLDPDPGKTPDIVPGDGTNYRRASGRRRGNDSTDKVREAKAYAAEASARSNQATDEAISKLKAPTSEIIAAKAGAMDVPIEDKLKAIAQEAQEAFGPKPFALSHPTRCPECDELIMFYKSTQAKHLGRYYAQCQYAHDEIEQLILQGNNLTFAQASFGTHYRKWAEPSAARNATSTSASSLNTTNDSSKGDATNAPQN